MHLFDNVLHDCNEPRANKSDEAGGVWLTQCGGMHTTGKDGAVDMNSPAVTERGIEVARQLDAPERVLESLERG